jgi:sterol 3beta-glucosyltransferase
MRFTILAVGTRGDFQPMLALGRGLHAAGHQVRIGTHENFAARVEASGLEYRNIGSDPTRIMESHASPGAEQEGTLARFRHVGNVLGPLMEEAIVNSRAICEGSDAILGNPVTILTGKDVATKNRTPYFLMLLQPAMRDRKLPCVLAPEWPFGQLPGRGLYNELTYELTDIGMWALLRRTVNTARRRALGLAPLEQSPIGAHRRAGGPMLVGVSPHVVPPPEDAPSFYQTTGYWFLEGDASYRPPPELEAFLAAGPPPLCVGFGSASGKEVAENYRLVISMARRNRWRTLLLTGWGKAEGIELPDHILAVREAPHDWLLPRVSAFVHHGGAGTTAAALRAGIPAVIMPYAAEARFWARRVHELGAGPAPIGLRTPPDRVEAAIRDVLEQPRLRKGAQAIGALIQREQGVERAVEFIERTLAGRASV